MDFPDADQKDIEQGFYAKFNDKERVWSVYGRATDICYTTLPFSKSLCEAEAVKWNDKARHETDVKKLERLRKEGKIPDKDVVTDRFLKAFKDTFGRRAEVSIDSRGTFGSVSVNSLGVNVRASLLKDVGYFENESYSIHFKAQVYSEIPKVKSSSFEDGLKDVLEQLYEEHLKKAQEIYKALDRLGVRVRYDIFD